MRNAGSNSPCGRSRDTAGSKRVHWTELKLSDTEPPSPPAPFHRKHQPRRRPSQILSFVAFVTAFVLVGWLLELANWRHLDQLLLQARTAIPWEGLLLRPQQPSQPQSTSSPAPLPTTAAPRYQPRRFETVIEQSPGGGYWIQGHVNGIPATLQIDTGADLVTVPTSIAQAAGLQYGPPIQSSTASDVIQEYLTVIPELTVGHIKFRDIQAAINPRSPSNHVLLGMSALKHLSLRQQHGRMVLSTLSETSTAATAGEVADFKRSMRDCMRPEKVVDQKTIDCLKRQ